MNTISMNDFYQKARSIMISNGLEVQAVFTDCSYRFFGPHATSTQPPDILFHISFFTEVSVCKQVEGTSPEVCLSLMRLFFYNRLSETIPEDVIADSDQPPQDAIAPTEQ